MLKIVRYMCNQTPIYLWPNCTKLNHDVSITNQYWYCLMDASDFVIWRLCHLDSSDFIIVSEII